MNCIILLYLYKILIEANNIYISIYLLIYIFIYSCLILLLYLYINIYIYISIYLYILYYYIYLYIYNCVLCSDSETCGKIVIYNQEKSKSKPVVFKIIGCILLNICSVYVFRFEFKLTRYMRVTSDLVSNFNF